MESCGGPRDGKEKVTWTTSNIIENRGKWSLGADVELLRHLTNFSDRISSQVESTSKALDALESDLATTCVGVHLVSNHFLSLADSQFVENRVYDDEESLEDKTANDSVRKSKEEEEAERFLKKKSAIANGLDVLRANFIPVEIPNIDSDDDDDDDVVDDDGAPIGIVYKPINPFENRPLPHLIGSKEFLTDPYVGIKSRLTDDEEEEDDDEEEVDEEDLSEKSSISKAFSVHEDSEPESDRVNIESADVPVLKPDSGALGKGGLSFAEHLTARLEGMKFEGKLDTSSDDSLPAVAPIKIPTTIDTTYEPVVRPYDTKSDRYYDNGFDDRYGDYDDSIFAGSKDQAQDNDDFDEEDLFLPNDDRNLESPLWGKSSQPIPNKQSLIRDLESKLKKDSNSTDSSIQDKSNLSASSSPNNRAMNPANDLFSDNGKEDTDSLFSVGKVNEPIKKKMPAGAVSIFGSNVDPFRNNSKTGRDKQDTTNRAPIKKKQDVVSSIKSSNSDNIDDDDEDSIFTSGMERTSSKNSSTKLSDSFHDDNLSIRSNKSSGLFESDSVPPPASTKAIDDLFKDIDTGNDDDDDLFSSYFTKSKKETSTSSRSRNDDIFSSTSKPKTAIVDDLFGDFKDDLFASVEDKGKTTSNDNNATKISKNKVSNLFSDSDSDSEFISSKKSNVSRVQGASIPSLDLPKKQLPSKSLFSDNDSSHNLSDDIFSTTPSTKSKNSDDVKISGNMKHGNTDDDIFVSKGKDSITSVDGKDLFKEVDNSNTKPKTVPPVKDSLANTKSSLSIFDDTDSDGDDGLFGISSSKTSNKLGANHEKDLFSQPSSKLHEKKGAQHSSSYSDKNSEPDLFSIKKDDFQSKNNPPSKPVVDLDVPSQPSNTEKTVEEDCDDLFSTSTSATVEIKTAIPKFEGSANNKIINTKEAEKEEAIAVRVDDPLFDDSSDILTSKTLKGTKTNSDSTSVALSSVDSIFGGIDDDEDDDSRDIFSNLGKSGFKSSKSNNEKTASSVPSSIVTNKKDDGFSLLKDDNDDGLFENTTSKSFTSEPSLVDDEKSTSLSVEGGYLSENLHVEQSRVSGEAKVDIVEEEVIVPSKSSLEGIVEANQSDSVGFIASTDPPLSKSRSLADADPLLSSQSTTPPKTSAKPQPPSKPSKPILPERSSKPSPPKTLNLPAPITFEEHAPDATDGGIISSQPKVESPKKTNPGKLNLQKTLNIDPRALLPGAQPKFKKPTNLDDVGDKTVAPGPQTEISTLEVGGKVKPESVEKISPSGVLTNVNKDRAKIQAKRRPPTRKARREALRHSTFEEDETDNSSSIATQSVADQTSSSVEPSNVLSPSTDEEDLFGVPPLDLPPDYSKVSTSPGDLFAGPATVLSPGLSATDNDLPVDDASTENPLVKSSKGDIFDNSIDTLYSIPSAGFDDPPELENHSNDVFNNSSSIDLFDDHDIVEGYPSIGEDISHKKVDDSKTSTETKLISEDEDADLFSNKPSRPREETLKNLDTTSSKGLLETAKIEPDPLASGLNFSEKTMPSLLSDEEDLFSTVSMKRDKKVVENTSSGLFSSSSAKKDNVKEITPSLFSSEDNSDDIFQTVSSVPPKIKSGNLADDSKIQPSSSKVKSVAKVSSKMDASGLFGNDEDEDEDLFGGKLKSSSTKQSKIPAKPSMSSSKDKLFGYSAANSKKSIFDEDEDSDIFSASEASIIKKSQSASKGATNVSKRPTDNIRPTKSVLSKTDPQEPFIDPLSNLNSEQ